MLLPAPMGAERREQPPRAAAGVRRRRAPTKKRRPHEGAVGAAPPACPAVVGDAWEPTFGNPVVTGGPLMGTMEGPHTPAFEGGPGVALTDLMAGSAGGVAAVLPPEAAGAAGALRPAPAGTGPLIDLTGAPVDATMSKVRALRARLSVAGPGSSVGTPGGLLQPAAAAHAVERLIPGTISSGAGPSAPNRMLGATPGALWPASRCAAPPGAPAPLFGSVSPEPEMTAAPPVDIRALLATRTVDTATSQVAAAGASSLGLFPNPKPGALPAGNQIRHAADTMPGRLFQHGAAAMSRLLRPLHGDQAAAHMQLQPCAVQYLLTASEASRSQKASVRDKHELRTLAEAMDHLAAGDPAAAGDCLMQRFKAVEMAAVQQTWENAKFLEVTGDATALAVSSEERVLISRMRERELRLDKASSSKGDAPWGASSASSASSARPPALRAPWRTVPRSRPHGGNGPGQAAPRVRWLDEQPRA